MHLRLKVLMVCPLQRHQTGQHSADGGRTHPTGGLWLLSEGAEGRHGEGCIIPPLLSPPTVAPYSRCIEGTLLWISEHCH